MPLRLLIAAGRASRPGSGAERHGSASASLTSPEATPRPTEASCCMPLLLFTGGRGLTYLTALSPQTRCAKALYHLRRAARSLRWYISKHVVKLIHHGNQQGHSSALSAFRALPIPEFCSLTLITLLPLNRLRSWPLLCPCVLSVPLRKSGGETTCQRTGFAAQLLHFPYYPIITYPLSEYRPVSRGLPSYGATSGILSLCLHRCKARGAPIYKLNRVTS